MLREGVGGFALGVASNRLLARPFKSLGNSPGAWVVHSRGELLHNREVLGTTAAKEAPCYAAGDVVSVRLSARQELSFAVNGAPLAGCCAMLEGEAAGYSLAVQPYMGGAARIISSLRSY